MKDAKRFDQEPIEGAGSWALTCLGPPRAFIKSFQNLNYKGGITPPLKRATKGGKELSFACVCMYKCILGHRTTLNLGSTFLHYRQSLNLEPLFGSWVDVFMGEGNALPGPYKPTPPPTFPCSSRPRWELRAGFGKRHVTLQSRLSSSL